MAGKTNEKWYDHDLIVFVQGHEMTGSGNFKYYSLHYGFRDPGAPAGITVIESEMGFHFLFYLQIADQLLGMGYEFFPAGADDPVDFVGIFI